MRNILTPPAMVAVLDDLSDDNISVSRVDEPGVCVVNEVG